MPLPGTKASLRKKRASPKKKMIDRGETEKDGLVCYKYKKVGHLRINYLKFRENPKTKKKALVAAWSGGNME